MHRCKDCGAKNRNTCNDILGLCSYCVNRLVKVAWARGMKLLDKPQVGEEDERQIMGVKLWYWRGQWRAL